MHIKQGLNKILSKAWEIIIVSALLAACAGMGSLLTQYLLKIPLDFSLMAKLMVLFFAIMAFGGVIYTLVSRHHVTA